MFCPFLTASILTYQRRETVNSRKNIWSKWYLFIWWDRVRTGWYEAIWMLWYMIYDMICHDIWKTIWHHISFDMKYDMRKIWCVTVIIYYLPKFQRQFASMLVCYYAKLHFWCHHLRHKNTEIWQQLDPIIVAHYQVVQSPQLLCLDSNGKGWYMYFRFDDDNKMSYQYIFSIT